MPGKTCVSPTSFLRTLPHPRAYIVLNCLWASLKYSTSKIKCWSFSISEKNQHNGWTFQWKILPSHIFLKPMVSASLCLQLSAGRTQREWVSEWISEWINRRKLTGKPWKKVTGMIGQLWVDTPAVVMILYCTQYCMSATKIVPVSRAKMMSNLNFSLVNSALSPRCSCTGRVSKQLPWLEGRKQGENPALGEPTRRGYRRAKVPWRGQEGTSRLSESFLGYTRKWSWAENEFS